MYNFILRLNNTNEHKKRTPKDMNIYVQGAPGMGLGNCLFQITLAIYYKEKYGMNIILRASEYILYGTSNKFGKTKCKMVDGKYVSYRDTILKKFKFCDKIEENVSPIRNDSPAYIVTPTQSMVVEGFSNNILLYKDILHKVPEYLYLHDVDTIRYIRMKYPNIELGIMIGIRAGIDGGFKNKLNKQSYINALEHYRGIGVCIDNLYIISDTKNVWRDNYQLDTIYPAVEVDEDDYTQLVIGMMCKHYVLSESTFHLWMAYIGTRDAPSKKVICFNNSDTTNVGWALENWIRIDW